MNRHADVEVVECAVAELVPQLQLDAPQFGKPSRMQASILTLETAMDPKANVFKPRDGSLVHGGMLRPDLYADWISVQEGQVGRAGPLKRLIVVCGYWVIMSQVRLMQHY